MMTRHGARTTSAHAGGARRSMTNRRMFLTMLRGAMLRRRSRALAALGSSTVGAATLFCLAAVCLALPAQMSAQMRQFGANLIVVPASAGAASDSDARVSTGDVEVIDQAVSAVAGIRAEDLATAAYRYETVRINKTPYLLAGIDVDDVRDLNGHWQVEGDWPVSGEVLVGLDVAEGAGLSVGSTVTVEYLSSDNLAGVGGQETVVPQEKESEPAGDEEQAHQAQWRVSGVVDTGGQEDDILYVPTVALEELTGTSAAGFDVIEYSVDTTVATVEAVAQGVEDSEAGDHVQARPVTKITSGDERIITMLNTLFWLVAVVVLALTLVGVSTTMTVIVSERRHEIGLRKALGASGTSIAAEFYCEAALLGAVGGTVGAAVGYGLAVAVGLNVFDRPIALSWWLAALVVLATALVAVVASVPPVRRASRIDPALVLREE